MPPVAPVLAMRSSASAWVVHVTLVPAELTSGNAKQPRPASALHDVRTNDPATHCANAPFTHATSFVVHEDDALSVANCAF